MKPIATLLLCALAATTPLYAQRYLLRDNRIINHADVIVKDGNLVRALPGGGEVAHPLSQVIRLDWPEPPEIAQARQLAFAGRFVEAEEKITPVYRQFAPFHQLPGSWWATAALIRARALLAQQKMAEAEQAARELMASVTEAETLASARLILVRVHLLQTKTDLAAALLEEIMRAELTGEVAALAAILSGDIAYARKEFERAIECYLQVPVFHGTEDALLPAALLGSARAYRAYGDKIRAGRAYLDLMAAYPESNEAAVAKTESGPS